MSISHEVGGSTEPPTDTARVERAAADIDESRVLDLVMEGRVA